MVYALDVYDPLDWSYPSGLKADKSGWQPRNKAWKAEREALWHKM